MGTWKTWLGPLLQLCGAGALAGALVLAFHHRLIGALIVGSIICWFVGKYLRTGKLK